MGAKRCINCMKEIDGNAAFCTYCGYAQNVEEQPPFGIKPRTILKGRYIVGRILGQGGFGITYAGYDLTLDIKVAIKEYFPMGFASRNYTVSNQVQWSTAQFNREQCRQGSENFLKEARRMAKLDSLTGIVRVRDTFPENGTSYIVMDFVEGETLKQKLSKTGVMGIHECLALLSPLMQSLGKMHQKGLVHRDISPDNIMIAPDGSACLLDFGAAKDVSMQQNAASQLVARKGFSPPEQYRNKGSIGPWTDVYALCATIYYCITGKLIPDAMERMYDDALTFDVPLKEPLSEPQKNALRDGLTLHPADRIQSIGELTGRLSGSEKKDAQQEPVKTQESGQKPAEPEPAKPKPFGKKKIRIVAGIAAVVLFAIIVKVGSGNNNTVKTDADPVAEKETELSVENVSEPDVPPLEELSAVQLGVSNANMINYSGYVVIPKQHLYYITGESELYHCTYHQEDQIFYMSDAEKVCDYGAYLTKDDSHIYFVTTDYRAPSLVRVDYDGSDMTQLYVSEDGRRFNYLQYVRFSDGREYLYYMLENERGAEPRFTSLYRYDLSDGENELLIEGTLYWYNLGQDGIYYTEVSIGDVVLSALKKADLDGNNVQVLDTDKEFLYGFAEDDLLYLYSNKDETVLAYNPDGTQNGSFGGFYDCNIDFDYNFGYGDGWFFYTGKDGSIHRVRANSTGDEVIAEGNTAVYICYDDSGLWFVENVQTEKDHQYQTQTYYAYKTGETMFELAEPDVNWRLDTAYIQDFEYTAGEDGEGIAITKYTGNATQFEIPDEIDGKPVVSIGESAFEGSSVQEVGLPEGLLSIGEKAFFGCADLTFIGLPEGLVEIGDSAFGTCSVLESVDFPESLTTIGIFAFAETCLSKVYIPSNVENIGAGAFALRSISGLTEFTVSGENKTFTTKEGALFSNDGMLLIALPVGAEGVYTVPDGTIGIQGYAFAYCAQLTGVTVPRSVKLIGGNAFFGTDISGITISSDCELKGELGGEVTVNYY